MGWLGIFCLIIGIVWAESFITYEEYASQLYRNPHGVSCAKCHGIYGNGRVVQQYSILKRLRNGEVRVISRRIIAPNIQHIPLKRLVNRLKHPPNLSSMPSYKMLADSEIEAIFYYLNYIAPAQLAQKLEKGKNWKVRKKRREQNREKGTIPNPQQPITPPLNFNKTQSKLSSNSPDLKSRKKVLPPPPIVHSFLIPAR